MWNPPVPWCLAPASPVLECLHWPPLWVCGQRGQRAEPQDAHRLLTLSILGASALPVAENLRELMPSYCHWQSCTQNFRPNCLMFLLYFLKEGSRPMRGDIFNFRIFVVELKNTKKKIRVIFNTPPIWVVIVNRGLHVSIITFVNIYNIATLFQNSDGAG